MKKTGTSSFRELRKTLNSHTDPNLAPILRPRNRNIPWVYNWESSLPENWKEISPRPLKRAPGIEGSRSTLDFLLETQKYISNITERMHSPHTEPKYPVSRLRPIRYTPLPQSPGKLLGSAVSPTRVSYRVRRTYSPRLVPVHKRRET